MNKKKTILVTSGAKRLGKHISKFFVMNDWDLILHYNNSKIEAEETARAAKAQPKSHGCASLFRQVWQQVSRTCGGSAVARPK